MKSASSDLIAFLDDATEYVFADCYTFTLSGGGVLRYSGTNMPVVVGENTFNLGPPIQDAGVQSQRGMSFASVDITIYGGDGRFTVNGVDILDFLENYGLDGAVVQIDRAFAPSWDSFYTNGPVGSYNRFKGNAGEIKELGQTQAILTVDSFMAVLQTSYPAEVYSTSCQNVFGDAKCGVDLPALQLSGEVTNLDSTAPLASFGTTLTQPNTYWSLGVITFTSGSNAGEARSIKAYGQIGGGIQLTSPLPAPVAVGDAFTVTPGCFLSLAACKSWDTPLSGPAPAFPFTQRFRGTPFIPPPTTGLPS